jgi:SAM-dependent methyltransferase
VAHIYVDRVIACSFSRREALKQSKSEFWSGEEYDAQYSHSYTSVISFLEQLIINQKASFLLDVCCGTGLVTIPLSTKLSHVVGIDFSSSMLAFAKHKSSGSNKIEFFEMDAADFNLSNIYDLVAMTGNAFQAFISDADFAALLRNIRNHMHDESIFVFDTRLPSPDNLETTSSYEYWSTYTSPTGCEVNVYGMDSKHPKSENTMLHNVRREYENGEQYDSHIELKYRSVSEITKYLKNNGLELAEFYSDWNKTPFNEFSTSLVGVVRPL